MVGAVEEVPLWFKEAWAEVDDATRECLGSAPASLVALALCSSAASIAYWQRHLGTQSHLAASAAARLKLDENEMLESAARELGLLLVRAADGQVLVETPCRQRISIEVKAASKTVTVEEVDKFRRRVKAGQFAAGILVSMRSPIARTPRGVHTQTEGGVALVLVSPLTTDNTMADLVRSALNAGVVCAATPRQHHHPVVVPSDLPFRATQRLVDCARKEIAVLARVKQKLRDAEGLGRHVSCLVCETIVASQQKLSSAVSSVEPATSPADKLMSTSEDDNDEWWDALETMPTAVIHLGPRRVGDDGHDDPALWTPVPLTQLEGIEPENI